MLIYFITLILLLSLIFLLVIIIFYQFTFLIYIILSYNAIHYIYSPYKSITLTIDIIFVLNCYSEYFVINNLSDINHFRNLNTYLKNLYSNPL